MKKRRRASKLLVIFAAVGAVLCLVGFGVAINSYQQVPVGHVAAGTFLGEIDHEELEEGLNFPVNPLKTWYLYDCRDKTLEIKDIGIPTCDQQITDFDVNIQYHFIDAKCSDALADTGTAEDVLVTHLIPQTRSILRKQGKAVVRCEDFFDDTTQTNVQSATLLELQAKMEPKGVQVTGILLRKPKLPQHIQDAIRDKKIREQEAEKQKAELERFATEQQQKVKQATAEKDAAAEQAEKIKLLADAKAYEIEKINSAAEGSPTYVQLQALQSLTEMSKDPATKLYFLNGESSQPFPLLNLGGDSPLTK